MRLRRNKKGMAMLLVLTSIVVITVIIVEMTYNSRIASTMSANDDALVWQAINQLYTYQLVSSNSAQAVIVASVNAIALSPSRWDALYIVAAQTDSNTDAQADAAPPWLVVVVNSGLTGPRRA